MNAYDVECAIETLFCETESPFTFKKVDVSKEILALTRPGMTVAVTSGKFESVDMSGDKKETATVVVMLVLKNVASEKMRRNSAHPAVDYVVKKLQGQTLNLDIDAFDVQDWRETTSQDFLNDGLMTIEITFTTAWNVVPVINDVEYAELKSIWTSYKDGEDVLGESRVIFNNNGES
ncbi:MAG: hypothetical protein WCS18_10730 [Sphaerochaetaceae bacterium]